MAGPACVRRSMGTSVARRLHLAPLLRTVADEFFRSPSPSATLDRRVLDEEESAAKSMRSQPDKWNRRSTVCMRVSVSACGRPAAHKLPAHAHICESRYCVSEPPRVLLQLLRGIECPGMRVTRSRRDLRKQSLHALDGTPTQLPKSALLYRDDVLVRVHLLTPRVLPLPRRVRQPLDLCVHLLRRTRQQRRQRRRAPSTRA